MNRELRLTLVSLLGISGLLCGPSCGDDEGTRGRVQADVSVRYLNVQDLGFPRPVFYSNPPLDVPGSRPPAPTVPKVRGVDLGEALVAVIKNRTGGDEAWGSAALAGKAFLETRSCILIARNTPVVLDKVEALLDEIRASGDPLAYIEANL